METHTLCLVLCLQYIKMFTLVLKRNVSLGGATELKFAPYDSVPIEMPFPILTKKTMDYRILAIRRRGY